MVESWSVSCAAKVLASDRCVGLAAREVTWQLSKDALAEYVSRQVEALYPEIMSSVAYQSHRSACDIRLSGHNLIGGGALCCRAVEKGSGSLMALDRMITPRRECSAVQHVGVLVRLCWICNFARVVSRIGCWSGASISGPRERDVDWVVVVVACVAESRLWSMWRLWAVGA